ncbi:carboxypeptidase-like regulatory domain-containing protein [Hymenobacter negativus]|uniref:Carboxypeptidase-like regulatory domain-containing protein n=1 Tax=Hymenobacter negativus TaxID=2795026 RepID=A0ABS3QGL5_9BACT|nr:carboxypeptidase-like regulatory domain-containing protein [Hymenobacter negativus]MBO2010391.1 carboxypeptidase-like regulatory domain-containing protein [Hymenobacter negativus]
MLPHLISIPQPCHESWDAMTPDTAGRHCAACQKTVVDFTQKTDAEILADLANASGKRTCGRFTAKQLERPLQPVVPVAPAARWRAWLAAAAAVWGVREATGVTTKAQAPVEWRARYWGGPMPAAPTEATTTQAAAAPETHPTVTEQVIMGGLPISINPVPTHLPLLAPITMLRGAITDAANGEAMAGATVLITGTTVGTCAKTDGTFELPLPPALVGAQEIPLSIVYIGYHTQQHTLIADEAANAQNFQLHADTRMLGEVVITTFYRKTPPAPWHPRRFYGWGKYWVTRPFRRW